MVLFNTYDSEFKPEHIDKFKNLVESKGAKLIDHIYVKRGSWYNQIDREELLEKFNAQLDKKVTYYASCIKKQN